MPRKISTVDRQRHSQNEVIFETENVRLQGWILGFDKVDAKNPLIIYYGGNAEECSHNIDIKHKYPSGNLLFVNYRGYGDSEGYPSETNLYADALAIFDEVTAGISPNSIILMGRSLGSCIAVEVASKRSVRSIVLVTPPDSLVNVGSWHYPFLPVSHVLRHRFDSIAKARKIKVPVLCIAGEMDNIVPPIFSMNLVNKLGGQYQFTVIPNADHNDIIQYPDYWKTIKQFVDQTRS